MNRQNQHKIENELVRGSPKFLFVNQNSNDINLNMLRSEKFRRDRDQQKKVVLNNDYKNDSICNPLRDIDKSVTTRYQNGNMFNKSLHSSSHSICSRYLKRQADMRPVHNDNDIQVQHNNNINVHKIEGTDTLEECVNCRDCHKTDHERFGSDKTTYCRPIVNLYNQQFLYKTMERNARLRKLLKEIIIARRREKESEHWNNYINKLKEKHDKETKIRHAASLQHVSEEFDIPATIEDYYNTKFMWKQSNPCQHLLQDFYETQVTKQSDNEYNTSLNNRPPRCNLFDRNTFCYPTSSQGRLILLERERQKRMGNRIYKSLHKTIDEYIERDNAGKKHLITRKTIGLHTRGTNTSIDTYSQTDCHNQPSINCEGKTTLANLKINELLNKLYTEPQIDIETVQENIQSNDKIITNKSLACIEEKLDSLICSINSFMVEIKTNRCSQNQKNLNRFMKLSTENVNFSKSDSFDIKTKEKVICGLIVNNSMSTKDSSETNFNNLTHMKNNIAKINQILLTDVGTEKIVDLKDPSVAEIPHQCSVQLSITIPTKEISTEVTSSLSKAEYSSGDRNVIEEINPPKRDDRRMAIAVNTDPVSFLALLRISTEETIRRLLSFVPSIDYYYYLSRLQGPNPRPLESHYICNICGAAFNKPSQLTDHIHGHELGNTRDCCVCRHMLDMPRRRPGLFKCQYCGQRFTRAYCCELHQQSCARRLGRVHDVESSLMLLR